MGDENEGQRRRLIEAVDCGQCGAECDEPQGRQNRSWRLTKDDQNAEAQCNQCGGRGGYSFQLADC